MPDDLPSSIGGFEVRRTLGEGGMGRVYACWDQSLEREVAIKVLLAEVASQPDMTERFLREAKAMAKVRSPHVVAVHQVGEDEAGPFLVMELLEGEDLASRIRREGATPLPLVVEWTRQAVAGLATASSAGLVHRDVKPENLFLTDEGVKLTDFGLARPLDGSANLTQAGLVVGSPHYIAPELARGAEATIKSDLYALGATLFEMLGGRPPYQGSTPVEVITAHLTGDLPDVRALRPDVPEPLAELCQRLLAKDPEARVGSYDAVLAVLDRVEPEVASRGAAGPSLDEGAPAGGAPDAGTATKVLGTAPESPASHDDESPPGETGKTAAIPAGGGSASRASRASGSFTAVKTDTLAVMFTDIAGYTERTGQQSRDEAAYWLEVHDALLKPVFRAFGGTVVKTIGDAFLVTFKSPTDAVHCGCAIQDRLYAHNGSAAEAEQIFVRVAISAGEVRLRKGDVLGEPVNLAARLEKLASPGDVVFADALYAIMNAAEVPADDLGEHEFKGIQRKVRVYGAKKESAGAPFGGRALERVKDGGVLPALDDARRRLAGALDQVTEGIGGVARRRPPRRALQAAGIALGVAALVGVGAWAVDHLGSGSDEPEPISEWDIPDLVAYLPDQNIDDIIGELARRDPDDLEDPLDDVLEEGNWPARHHAMEVLEKVGLATDERRQTVAIRDMLEAKNCNYRKAGLNRLRRYAVDERAMEAYEEARARGNVENWCFAMSWASAKRSIEKRLEARD